MDKLKEIRRLLHDLSNTMVIIKKAHDVYSKQLPEHKITAISNESMNKTLAIIRELKSITADDDSEQGA